MKRATKLPRLVKPDHLRKEVETTMKCLQDGLSQRHPGARDAYFYMLGALDILILKTRQRMEP